MVAQAHAIVLEQMDAIADPADRARYMGLAVNRDVVAAIERDEWPVIRKLARTRR
jgi:hypothetical protein